MLVDFEFNMLTSYFQWNLDRWVWKRVASTLKISELTAPKQKLSVFSQFWLTRVHCHWWNHPKIMSFTKTSEAKGHGNFDRDSTNLSFSSRRNKGEPRLKGLDTKRLKAKEMAILRTVMTSHTSERWAIFWGGSTLSCWSITGRFQSEIFDWTLSHTFFPFFWLRFEVWLLSFDWTMAKRCYQQWDNPNKTLKDCLKHFQNIILMFFLHLTLQPLKHLFFSTITHLQKSTHFAGELLKEYLFLELWPEIDPKLARFLQGERCYNRMSLNGGNVFFLPFSPPPQKRVVIETGFTVDFIFFFSCFFDVTLDFL